MKIVNKDTSPSSPDEESKEVERTSKPSGKRDLCVVLKKLSDKRDCHEYTQSIVNQKLTEKNDFEGNEEKCMEKPEQCKTMYLEGIKSSNEGVFQTMGCENAGEDLMKSEVWIFTSL